MTADIPRLTDDELTALLAEQPTIVRPPKTAKKPNLVGVVNRFEEKSFLENLRRFIGQSEEMDRAIELIADLRERQVRLATEVRDLRAVAKAGAQTDRDHETLFQDLEEEPCRFDHNGFCQSHYWTGSEPNKCGLAEAKERWNAFLAALARYEEGGR